MRVEQFYPLWASLVATGLSWTAIDGGLFTANITPPLAAVTIGVNGLMGGAALSVAAILTAARQSPTVRGIKEAGQWGALLDYIGSAIAASFWAILVGFGMLVMAACADRGCVRPLEVLPLCLLWVFVVSLSIWRSHRILMLLCKMLELS